MSLYSTEVNNVIIMYITVITYYNVYGLWVCISSLHHYIDSAVLLWIFTGSTEGYIQRNFHVREEWSAIFPSSSSRLYQCSLCRSTAGNLVIGKHTHASPSLAAQMHMCNNCGLLTATYIHMYRDLCIILNFLYCCTYFLLYAIYIVILYGHCATIQI